MFLRWLQVAAEFFEVVVGGFRSFLRLVTTHNIPSCISTVFFKH